MIMFYNHRYDTFTDRVRHAKGLICIRVCKQADPYLCFGRDHHDNMHTLRTLSDGIRWRRGNS